MTRRRLDDDAPAGPARPIDRPDERPPANPRDYGDWSRRYLEHAPFAVAVVRGHAHLLVHANAAFRRLAALRTITQGRPLTEGFAVGTARELDALLDRVLQNGRVAREAVISPAGLDGTSWRFTVWPVANRGGRIDQLVIVMLERANGESADASHVRHADIAERLLLSALREQMVAEEAEAARQRAAFLAAAAVRVGASLDPETTYASIADLALPRPGTWCVVDIIGTGGILRRLAIVHPDPAKHALARTLEQVWLPETGDPFGAPLMIRSPRPVQITERIDEVLAASAHGSHTLEALHELGIGPLLVVPLSVRGEVIGAITFVSREGDPPYARHEMTLAVDLAAACASAIESARLYDEATIARAAAETAQRDAEAANQAKSRFLSMMTHDLRTPLNAIGGYAQLLDLGIRGPVNEAQHHDLARIKVSQQHLLSLINRILGFAKLEAGKIEYEIEDVPLAASIREIESFVTPQLYARKLAYRFEPAPGAAGAQVRVRADPEKLMQILTNLLTNAIKFTEPGGSITVGYELRGDDQVSVSVRDTGRGVAPDELTTIFEPFVQVGGTLSTAPDGVGLGLAICRELARGMGGDLTVQSVPGEGSVFTLALPRAAMDARG